MSGLFVICWCSIKEFANHIVSQQRAKEGADQTHHHAHEGAAQLGAKPKAHPQANHGRDGLNQNLKSKAHGKKVTPQSIRLRIASFAINKSI